MIDLGTALVIIAVAVFAHILGYRQGAHNARDKDTE